MNTHSPDSVFYAAVGALKAKAWQQAAELCDPVSLSLFKREEGFFVGAILANVVTTELVILLVCFFFLLVIGAQYSSVLILLFVPLV